MPSTGETTVIAYDASGKLVAEYSTNIAAAQDAKVAYLTSDHLGSPRINTDQNGAVIARHDYHPFGEEIFTAQRTTGLNYSADSVRQKFTGYQRDSETSLDFAQARMYANRLGRFSCPDYFFNDTNPVNPQKWNLYGYVLNNPLNFTDPTGEIIETENGKIKFDPAKDSKGANIQKEKSILEGRNKAGNTVIFTAVYTQGTIYTDSKTPVEAEQLDREKGVTMRTYDKDGNVISQTTISVDDARKGGIRPESNCFGSAFANQEVWINNDKGQVAKIIAGDNYSLTTSPSRDDVGLYFRGKQGVAGESGDANFDKVRHATTVWEVAEGKVSIVISKDKATLAVTAEPGPGKNTAWPERKTHIRYYSKGN